MACFPQQTLIGIRRQASLSTNPEQQCANLPMKHLLSTILAAWMAFTVTASANGPVVVELYTSQGCSSCPPADKLFHQIAQRDDVIALSLHVDYWDYIGWKDEFADPAHAMRQRDYARKAGRRSIYTPEMIVNGMTDIVGARPIELAEAIMAHKDKGTAKHLNLARADGSLTVSSEPMATGGPFVVHMLRYQPAREARITRGENAGHTLSYANVVEDWTVLGQWDGRTPLNLDTPVTGDAPVVVLVQGQRKGRIFAAGRLR